VWFSFSPFVWNKDGTKEAAPQEIYTKDERCVVVSVLQSAV
jgi:hypothetical protein